MSALARRALVVEVVVHKAHLMSANDRKHWSKKRVQTSVLRALAAADLRAVLAPLGLYPSERRPLMQRAHVVVEVAWPTRRRRDVANVAPTVKALIDGLVTDGHLLPDDDDAHLTGPDLRPAGVLSGKPGHTRLTFHIHEEPQP